MRDAVRGKSSWQFWAIAALSLLWNAFGCLDFIMTVTRNPAYMAQFPPDMINWLDAAPLWTLIPWATGVGGALAGSLLLLVRSRHAVTAFALSLAGLAVTQIWQVMSGMPESMTTPANLGITIAIWIVALALLWFAHRQRARGVLR